MKQKTLYIFLLLCFSMATWAQMPMNGGGIPTIRDNGQLVNPNQRNDSITNKVDANSVPREVHAWQIDPRFGEVIAADVDTLFLNFQNSNETYGMNGEYNMLGNMGSPRLSRIFINRKDASDAYFLDPYDFFVRRPDTQLFYNTKSPFTNLSYWASGNKVVGDDRVKALFTVNANKRLNFGFVLDYLYGRGYYQYQGTSFFNGALFSSFIGEKYQMHALFSANHMKMVENGGIEDDNFITHPEDMSQNISSNTIPTILDQTWNRNDSKSLYLSHRYNVGFHRVTLDTIRTDSTSLAADSLATPKVLSSVFVPVTSFIHTLEVDHNHHQFIEYNSPSKYYNDVFLPGDSVLDRTKYFSIKNTLAIQLKEGFNKWAQAGLTAFAKFNYRSYQIPGLLDGHQVIEKYNESVFSIGGMLSRRQGKHLNYEAFAETFLSKPQAGDYHLDAKLSMNFKLLNDTISFTGHAFMKSLTPTFYLRHFHGKHYWWDNDFGKETRTRLEGILNLKRTESTLRIAVENIDKYTYLDNISSSYMDNEKIKWSNGVDVKQYNKSIRVFTAQLLQNFKLGILHWDNEITYQTTNPDAKDVLPLPKLNIYSNLYLKFNLVKNVLRMQIGGDVRYFTRYYAPDYVPGLNQFYLQNNENRIQLGNYPFVNTYINAEWKRTRIYAMVFFHVNQGMGDRMYFMAPHYPVNPQIFKLGISWNFYD